MAQENKELLFKDLSARLPYRTMVKCNTDYRHEFDERLSVVHLMNFYQWETKPYLRPMSSMTEAEVAEFESITDELLEHGTSEEIWNTVIDWLNSHHFDHRHLIEKGLAIEAPEGMYDLKKK